MSRLVVDTSVFIKLFVEEEGSADAREAVAGAEALLAPDLLWLETANVLWKRVRRQQFSPDEASGVMHAALRSPLLIVASVTMIDDALRIAMATDRSVYDCTYLALAVREHATLITADVKFARSLQSTPMSSFVMSL